MQDEHDAAVAAQDLPRIFRLNVQFHRVLYAGCGNPYLAGVIDGIAKDPKKALEGIKKMIPGQGGAAGGSGSAIPKPEDALKKLFGR